ncbi:MAG: hypothetical protein AAF790_05765 [Planctomycetota bacterium]
MRRTNATDGELPGQDSFLDIVANIVGILILLVMVVGLRAASVAGGEPAEGATEAQTAEADGGDTPDEPPVSEQDVERAVRLALAERAELQSKVVRAVNSRAELELRDQERVHLATLVAAVEQEIEEQREKMNADDRRDFDLRAKLGAAEFELEELARERIALASAEPEVEQVESLPTPLAMRVSTDELHVRLAVGRAKLIPIDRLLEAAKRNMRENAWRLNAQPSVELWVGPIDGFRMVYQLQKHQVASPQGTQTYIAASAWQIHPEAADAGEPVAEAVLPGSGLMRRIARAGAGKPPTITVWTYPDSFGEFRELKRALFEAGYSVAGRPLPAGELIGGSPNGTKSAAQ